MGASVDTYKQVKPIVDALAQVIGQFDPQLISRDQRALLHAAGGAAPVIIIQTLINKGVITLADLAAARDAAYADPAWPTVAES